VFAGGLAGCGAPPAPNTVRQPDEVDVKPQAGMGTLRGTVRDFQGNPVPNFAVTLSYESRVTQTDARGVYTFANVPPGRYDLIWPTSDNPRMNEMRPMEVKPDLVTRADIQLPEPRGHINAKPYGAPPARRRIV
jgi:hypothetical protein